MGFRVYTSTTVPGPTAHSPTAPDGNRPARLAQLRHATRQEGGGYPSRAWLLVAVITAIGVALRIPSLSDSLYGDELSAYFVVTGNGFGEIVELVQGDGEITPPLCFLLARLAQTVADPVESLRWVSLIAGVASIPLTYTLGAQTVGRKAGLVAAAVMALSPFVIFFSSEARPYGLMLLLCLGSTLLLLRALNRGSALSWALYGACACAAMYTHYTSIFVLVGQFGWAIASHRSAWRWLAGVNALAALGWALPWMSNYRADQASPGTRLIGLLQPFGFDAVKTDVLHWAVGHPIAALPLAEVPGRAALVLIAVGLAVGLVAFLMDIGRRAVTRPNDRVVLVLVLALSSPVVAAAYSALSVSVFQPRNLIASTPGLALALALLVTRPRRKAVWISATTLIISGFVVGALQMVGQDSQRPDYKRAVALIEDRGGDPSVTVDSPGLSPGPLTALDVAFAPGSASPTPPAALRLGRPTRPDQMRAQLQGGAGQFANLPVPPPRALARQAQLRANGRRIFLIAPGNYTYSELTDALPQHADATARLRSTLATQSDAAAFVRALPKRYRPLGSTTLPGLFGYGSLTIYALAPDP